MSQGINAQGEKLLITRIWDGTDVADVTAANALKTDASATTQPISAVSLPLPTGAATSALQLPDGHNVTVDNAAGAAAVNVQDGGNSLTVDNAALAVVGGGVEATALRVTVASDSTGVLSVDDNGGALTVDQATASSLNAQVVGATAHDAGIAGNPVGVSGVSVDTDDTAPPNRVSAEAEVTRLATDRDGSLHVLPYGPQVWSYHENSSSALTDTTVHAAPGANLSLYVGTVVVSTGAATALNIFFEEGASTVLGPYYLEAVAGRGLTIQFNPPKKITANTALTVTTSAAIAHGIDVTGFVAQG